jgi:hypothetical protein
MKKWRKGKMKWENDKMVIEGSNKWQEIKYAVNRHKDNDFNWAEPYVRYKNQRIWLDDFFVSIYGYKEESALCGVEIHAAASSSIWSSYLLHINKDGDQAKVFYSYNK